MISFWIGFDMQQRRDEHQGMTKSDTRYVCRLLSKQFTVPSYLQLRLMSIIPEPVAKPYL